MPELPEVQALVDFLAERTDGLAITAVELASFSVLKTFNPPPQALEGAPVDGVHRHGKFLDIDADGTHLVFHLARAGWLRWSDQLPTTVCGPASRRSPCGCASRRLRLRPDRGRHEEVARRLHRHATPPRCPASPGSGPTRSPTTSRSSASRAMLGAAPHADQGAAARPGVHRRRRQRLLRRDPARRQDHPLRASPARSLPRSSTGCMPPCATRSTVRSPPRRASRPRSSRTPSAPGMRVHARTGETVPGVRRRRARGVLRRHVPAVLRHLPDRRQAARRPPDEQAAQVRHRSAPVPIGVPGGPL